MSFIKPTEIETQRLDDLIQLAQKAVVRDYRSGRPIHFQVPNRSDDATLLALADEIQAGGWHVVIYRTWISASSEGDRYQEEVHVRIQNNQRPELPELPKPAKWTSQAFYRSVVVER